MRMMLRRYRRGAVVVSTMIGSLLIALAMAVPAGASDGRREQLRADQRWVEHDLHNDAAAVRPI